MCLHLADATALSWHQLPVLNCHNCLRPAGTAGNTQSSSPAAHVATALMRRLASRPPHRSLPQPPAQALPQPRHYLCPGTGQGLLAGST